MFGELKKTGFKSFCLKYRLNGFMITVKQFQKSVWNSTIIPIY